MKPLFRWTVGPCIQQGLDILAESVKKTTKTIGLDRFDWMICHNGLKESALSFLQNIVANTPIRLYEQKWIDVPIDEEMRYVQNEDGTFNWNGNVCGGSFWKVVPPRMRMEAHEIVMDNDVILLNPIEEIEQFLKLDKVLVLHEPIRFYGRYDYLFPTDHNCLNSGLMGFPPHYDFGADIKKNWEETGKLKKLSQADEQGLLMYTLNQKDHIGIGKHRVVEVLARDYTSSITGNEGGIHFTQSNKIPNRSWVQYNKLLGVYNGQI